MHGFDDIVFNGVLGIQNLEDQSYPEVETEEKVYGNNF